MAADRSRPQRSCSVRAACWALLGFASCAAPPEATGDLLPPEFETVLRDYEKAWQARDAAALTALFTDDGWVMSSGRPPVRGHAQIAERYAGSGGPLALRSLHWERQGDLAIILGAYGPRPDAVPSGKFTLTLRRGRDGRWRILSDMDNGNARR